MSRVLAVAMPLEEETVLPHEGRTTVVVKASGFTLPAASKSLMLISYLDIISTMKATKRSVSSGLVDESSFAAAKSQNFSDAVSLGIRASASLQCNFRLRSYS